MAYTNIDDPSAHFQAIRWTGNGSDGRALTNDGNSDLQPDWVWLKANVGYNHFLTDSSRGVTKYLSSDATTTESTLTNMVESFDTDGFTIGYDGSQVPNYSGNIIDAWQWKANGGTTSTNTDGDINSTVQVNSDAGFSIVQYNPSNTTARSIGHGLGVQPQVVIVRARDRVENWRVFHRSAGTTGALILDDTTAYNSSTTLFTADSTSTVFKVGTDFSVNGGYNYIAYCFANVQGYSKHGKYIGNGSTDGAFAYTGFKPAFIMFKKSSDSGDNWMMYDNNRPGYNVTNQAYHPNSTAAEYTNANANLDILSNGFKLRSSFGWVNQNTHTYIYMAFAENPFVTSTGIPTTAR